MDETTTASLTPHEEWIKRIETMSPTARQWGERTKHPLAPEPGSSLAEDDMDGLDVEATVWYLLCVSVEHFNFTIDVMQKTRSMYPTAYMTVVRTAYLASVNALWILTGATRQQRRQRTLRFAAEDLKVQIAAIVDFSTTDETAVVREAKIQDLRRRQDDLQAIATELGTTEDVRNMRVNQTDVVSTIVAELDDEEKDGDLANGIRYIWRSGSAAAHAQNHFGRNRISHVDVIGSEGGKSVVMLTGSLADDVGPAMAGVFLALLRAFKLYEAGRVR